MIHIIIIAIFSNHFTKIGLLNRTIYIFVWTNIINFTRYIITTTFYDITIMFINNFSFITHIFIIASAKMIIVIKEGII